MLTQQQFYVYYTDYTIIIDGMNEKLKEAKIKFPEKDFKSQEETIGTILFLRQLFHHMYHDQQSIENESGKIMTERHNLITKCSRLEKELETLKSNIDLIK